MVKVLKSFWRQALGLMFTKSREPALFIFKEEKRLTIHTFFMHGAIIVQYFNKDKDLIESKRLEPWSWYKNDRAAMYVKETPQW